MSSHDPHLFTFLTYANLPEEELTRCEDQAKQWIASGIKRRINIGNLQLNMVKNAREFRRQLRLNKDLFKDQASRPNDGAHK